jgi:[protein-PII] uridylyltransferase
VNQGGPPPKLGRLPQFGEARILCSVSGGSLREATDLARLSPVLEQTCADYLARYRAQYVGSVERGESGLVGPRDFAASFDGLLGALHCAARATVRKCGLEPKGRFALVAVGGYGRRTLGLFSDIDVLFLCDDPMDPYVGAVTEALLYPLWNLGVDIGHAVRGVPETIELAQSDLRTATTLMDLRLVGGDASIVAELEREGRQRIFEPRINELLDQLAADTALRHERYGDSLYLLEPEVKNGRGGLRDLDVARWAALARWNARTGPDYVDAGILLDREVEAIDDATEMLWRVRNLLHVRAGRRQDRLTFGDQEEISVALGFVDGIVLGVEQFMQAYYRHARIVAQTSERLLERARKKPERMRSQIVDLGDGTMLSDGEVSFEKPERLGEDPALPFRLYRQVVRRRAVPSSAARDAIARHAERKDARRAIALSEESIQLFLSLLTEVSAPSLRGESILAELHEMGLLVAVIPEFAPLTGRVHHDVYHVYTVDVHCIRAVDRLRALLRGDAVASMGLAARLSAEAPRLLPVFVALLLHAIGKARGGGDYAERGAEMARPIAERLGLSTIEVEHVQFLIREQHSLYRFATQRDVHDPEVLNEALALVENAERLRDLYLVNVCILSTTNPEAMTTWKARTFEDLYVGISMAIEQGGLSAPGRMAQSVREEVRLAPPGDLTAEARDAFLASMPDRYLLAHSVHAILDHARFSASASQRDVAVRVASGPTESTYEIVVETNDRPGLLADLAAVLSGHRFVVIGAEIYTRSLSSGDRAFDVFVVTREGEQGAALDPAFAARLERDFCRLLEGETTAEELLALYPGTPAWAQRHSPDVPTEVVVDNEASSRFTLIDVFTKDRPRLLHDIARTLHAHGLSIALSKLNTEGERVADVFYVEAKGGGRVAGSSEVAALQKALVEVVELEGDEA